MLRNFSKKGLCSKNLLLCDTWLLSLILSAGRIVLLIDFIALGKGLLNPG